MVSRKPCLFNDPLSLNQVRLVAKKHVNLATAFYSTKFGWQFLIKSLQFEWDLQIGHIVSFVYKIYISVILLKEILHHLGPGMYKTLKKKTIKYQPQQLVQDF